MPNIFPKLYPPNIKCVWMHTHAQRWIWVKLIKPKTMRNILKIVRENKMHHLEKPIIKNRAQLKYRNPKDKGISSTQGWKKRASRPEFCMLKEYFPKVKVKWRHNQTSSESYTTGTLSMKTTEVVHVENRVTPSVGIERQRWNIYKLYL